MWFAYVYSISGNEMRGPYSDRETAEAAVRDECGEDGAFDYGGVVNLPFEWVVKPE